MRIADYADVLLKKLNAAGYHTAAVGGCVRDSLLHTPPHDFDLATAAPWQAVKALFDPEYTVIETGVKHGTVTVLSDRHPVEITTFRIESTYSDGRHPDAVSFTTDLTADLARRDFTVNAMAFDGEVLHDPFGGQKDLVDRIIRCVGDPNERLCEDALRILRALRFAAQLGFAIEPATAQALHRHAELLKNVSAERCYTELKKLLCGAYVKEVLLAFPDVLGVILPQLLPLIDLPQNNPHHRYDVWTHTVHAVAAVEPVEHLRLAALFHDTGKADTRTTDEAGIDHFYGHAAYSVEHAKAALTVLKSDKQTLNTVCALVRSHDIPISPERPILMRRLRQFGEELLLDILALQKADHAAQAFHPERAELFGAVEDALERLLNEKACFSLSDLAINGRDLIELGFTEGKRIGDALQILLEAVCEGEIENDRAILLKQAETMK